MHTRRFRARSSLVLHAMVWLASLWRPRLAALLAVAVACATPHSPQPAGPLDGATRMSVHRDVEPAWWWWHADTPDWRRVFWQPRHAIDGPITPWFVDDRPRGFSYHEPGRSELLGRHARRLRGVPVGE